MLCCIHAALLMLTIHFTCAGLRSSMCAAACTRPSLRRRMRRACCQGAAALRTASGGTSTSVLEQGCARSRVRAACCTASQCAGSCNLAVVDRYWVGGAPAQYDVSATLKTGPGLTGWSDITSPSSGRAGWEMGTDAARCCCGNSASDKVSMADSTPIRAVAGPSLITCMPILVKLRSSCASHMRFLQSTAIEHVQRNSVTRSPLSARKVEAHAAWQVRAYTTS